MTALFEQARHESVTDDAWDPGRVHTAIERIVSDTHQAYEGADGLWRLHPLDRSSERPAVLKNVYSGAAGVIWALHRLHESGHADAPADYGPALETLVERNRADTAALSGSPVRSYLGGDTGILLLKWKLRPTAALADALHVAIDANTGHRSRGFLWGASGTMFAARWLLERTGDRRWAALYRRGAAALWDTWQPLDRTQEYRVWTNELYGFADNQLGALHGFAGNVGEMLAGQALLSVERQTELLARALATLHATAIRADGLANWPMTADLSSRPGAEVLRVQHCMGAPGIVNCLAQLPRDLETDALLEAAGELIWSVGPPIKVPCLCHGTPGNGYAFLRLFARTGDDRWVHRARRFAMHAIRQSDRVAQSHGRKYSVWTGDLGVALYLSSCLSASSLERAQVNAELPTLQFF